jgi:hypothetical protein
MSHTVPSPVTVPMPDVILAGTRYRVEEIVHAGGRESTITLTGPRGGHYFLRGYLSGSAAACGVQRVISWSGGQPLRHKGNEVRVIFVGDQLEEYVPAPRPNR